MYVMILFSILVTIPTVPFQRHCHCYSAFNSLSLSNVITTMVDTLCLPYSRYLCSKRWFTSSEDREKYVPLLYVEENECCQTIVAKVKTANL